MENSNKDKQINVSKNTTSRIFETALDLSFIRKIVTKSTVFLLPILFWLALFGILIFAIFTFLLTLRISIVTSFITFIGTIIVYLPSLIIGYYLLFLLMDIRNSLQKK